jgi:hypothetical protein
MIVSRFYKVVMPQSVSFKRQKVQAYILDVITMQDPSKYNTKVYQDFFDGLNDQQFHDWMTALKNDPHAKITLLVPPFTVVIDIESSIKTAEYLGVQVMERLRLWDPVGQRYCLTPERYFILKLPVRRLKQYGLDGLSVPDSDKRLNPLTDQVVKPDKGSAISFPQAQMIAEKGLTTTLKEMMTIRGGDLQAYSRLTSEIEETGDSDTSVAVGTAGVKSVQTLRSFLNAMHLDSNL